MKLIIVLSIFCITLATCMAAVSRGVYKDPEYPGKCVVEGLILSPGEDAKHPHSCQKILCSEDSQVQFHSCGVVAPPPGFKLGEHSYPDADYPDCCDRNFIAE